MRVLRDFEVRAVEMLSGSLLTQDELRHVASASVGNYEFTGGGYFVTVSSPQLPPYGGTSSTPMVVGEASGIYCGFVLYVDSHQVTLECHVWGEAELPTGFRDMPVNVRLATHYSLESAP
jgi:hypothetical protein